MAMTVSELQVVVSADTSKAEAGLKAVGGAISSFAGALTVGAAAAGAGLAAGVAVGIKAAGDLEQAVANISTIKPDIDTSAMFATLNEMSTRIPQTSAQLGESLYNIFSSMDVSTEGATRLLEVFSKGAVGAQTDAETFGTAVMGVMNAYKLAVEDAGDVSDWFFDIVNKGVVTGQELASSLGPVVASAKAAGVEWRDLGPMLAAVTKEGGPAAQNINNLNNFLQKITTKDAQAELGKLGVATKTATGDLRSPLEVLTDLKRRTDGMTESAKALALQEIFPDAQARIGAQVLMSQIDMVREGTEAAQVSSGSAAAAYEKMSQTFNAQSKLLVNGLKAVGVTIGGELLPYITPLVTTLSQALPGAFTTARAAIQPYIAMLADAGRTIMQVFGEGWEPSDQIDPFVNAVGIAATAVLDASTIIADSWRTVGQVFAGEWEPSDQIDPLVDAVGQAAQAVKALADGIIEAATRAGSAGAWSAIENSLGNLQRTIEFTGDRFNELAATFDRVGGGAGIAADPIDVLAGMIRGAALGFEYATVQLDGWVDSVLSGINVAANFVTGLSLLGTASQQFARQDIQGMIASIDGAGASFSAGITAAEDYRARALERTGVQADISAQLIGRSTAQIATSTETDMAAAATSAAAAMDEMVAAVEAAGPQMEEAAGSAARRAAAAVEAQSGAAQAAGQSVGDSIGSGLVAGIKSWIGSVIAAGAELAAAAVGAARGPEGADAHSPSRKMIELGKDMANGLEQGLADSGIGAPMVAQIRDFMAAAREYVPVAGEIKRVESEIAGIRENAQTEALFRAKEMVTIDSEALRLKQAQVSLERDLVPLRQDLARATREVTDIERGSLGQRTGLIEQDAERKQLRLQQIELEKQLIGLDSGSKRATAIKEQIDKLREQDRALALEAERISLNNQIAATGARIRREQLDDQARGQQAVIDLIGEQIAVLAAEQSVFQANENVIKNATQNEIDYRNQLIAVFRAEGQPIADRISAGLALIDQLEKEGAIGEELADALRAVAKETGAVAAVSARAVTASEAMATAAAEASQAAREQAASFDSVKNAASSAERAVAKYVGTLNELPSGKFGGSLESRLKGRATGGPVSAGAPYIVGERRAELFVPESNGVILPSVPRMGTSNGGVTVVFNGPVYGLADFEEQVISVVGSGLRRGVGLGSR
jgi:TP901 family phage tail tape measure protein